MDEAAERTGAAAPPPARLRPRGTPRASPALLLLSPPDRSPRGALRSALRVSSTANFRPKFRTSDHLWVRTSRTQTLTMDLPICPRLEQAGIKSGTGAGTFLGLSPPRSARCALIS